MNLQVTATPRRHVPVLMRGFNESCGAVRGLLLAVSTAVPQTVACGESANIPAIPRHLIPCHVPSVLQCAVIKALC